MISLLVDLDNVLREEGSTSNINIIVTTRPEPTLLSPLKSHWKGERYQQFTPAELRAEEQSRDNTLTPLLRTLIALIGQMQPDLTTFQSEPRDLNTAYERIFNRGGLAQAKHRAVLEVVLASYEPQSLSDLKAIDGPAGDGEEAARTRRAVPGAREQAAPSAPLYYRLASGSAAGGR